MNLHFDIPGQPGFDSQETMASSPTRMQILNGHKLVALVEPGTQRYEIDWDASALLAGVEVPAEFTLDEDHKTYDLSGKSGPLFDILTVLHASRIPGQWNHRIRSNPVVRQQVMDIVRRAGAGAPDPGPAAVPHDLRCRHAGPDRVAATAGTRHTAGHRRHQRDRIRLQAPADPGRPLRPC